MARLCTVTQSMTEEAFFEQTFIGKGNRAVPSGSSFTSFRMTESKGCQAVYRRTKARTNRFQARTKWHQIRISSVPRPYLVRISVLSIYKSEVWTRYGQGTTLVGLEREGAGASDCFNFASSPYQDPLMSLPHKSEVRARSEGETKVKRR